MSVISNIFQTFSKDVVYLIDRIQKGCSDQITIEKTILTSLRILNAASMVGAIISFTASVVQANVGGIISAIVLFVASFEIFHFLRGRQDIIESPDKCGLSALLQGSLGAILGMNVEAGVQAGLRDLCASQVKGTIFKPIWVELQMKLLYNHINPFPLKL